MTTQERVAKSIIAKRRKAEARARAAAEQHAALEGHLAGTSWIAPADTAARLRAGDGASSTERVRAHRARGRELPPIPPTRHRRVRASCRHDLLRFGMLYCFGHDRLLHRPPSERMIPFVRSLQETILNGGNRHVRWPRGKGKTTWLKIAAIWSLLYGHRRFVLFIAAAKNSADTAVREIWLALSEYPGIASDFPEIAIPLADVAMTPQRARVQTCNGKWTGIEDTSARGGHRRLPRLDGYPDSGGIIAARGADQRIRGLNVHSIRPDFIFIDDPQTGAETDTVLDKIEKNIQQTILNLGSSDVRTAAIMASTPVRLNDISERFADPDRNPAWETITEKLVIEWGPEEWIEQYFEAKRHGEKSGREFYLENREKIENGVVMLDPGDGDRRTQVSAYQYALDKLFEIGNAAFFAEYQMKPPASSFAFEISQRLILSRIRKGIPPFTIPNGNVLTVAATDINPSYGLTTAIISFDITLAGLVVGYKIMSVHIPESLNEVAFEAAVYNACAAAGTELAALNLRIDRWGIDAGGRQFKAVTRFAPNSASLCGLEATPMLGRAGKNWNPFVRSRIRSALNDTVRCRNDEKREWLAWNADSYKERAQKAWGALPGAPGSLSLFDGADHSSFATQIANERLKGKTAIGDDRWKYTWDSLDPHDYGDAVAMCYALAGSEGLTGDGTYEAESEEEDVVFL